MIKASIVVLFPAMMTLYASGEQLYINARSGNDTNAGTKNQPLKTIGEAARRISASDKAEATTVVLSEGVYPLTETALFHNDKYTVKDRLVIRAEILPDDVGWTPQRMPVIVAVVPMTLTQSDGEEARGLEIEASHVTIEGLRFSGSPAYYYIDGKQNRRYYPIWRDGKKLDDLLVTQCLFAGDVDVLPIRVAVIANGHGLVLDHHNIITGSNTGWISEGSHRYRLHDCIFAGNTIPAGFGNEATGKVNPSPIDFQQMDNVQTTGVIEIEKDQGKNNYLQLKKGSAGSVLKAGLFRD